MAIADLYSSGLHKRSLGHFSSIVKLALVDGFLGDGEKKLLDKMAKRLEITAHEYEKIIEDPNVHPINPPVGYERRIERFYNLTKMVFADGEATGSQIELLKKVCIGLGFSQENYEEVTKVAVNQIMNEKDLVDFSDAIKKVN